MKKYVVYFPKDWQEYNFSDIDCFPFQLKKAALEFFKRPVVKVEITIKEIK